MKDFTFLTLSYNQEKYIIQHLESIKYQIEKFGENYRCYYILCDDCSKDQTVEYAKKWCSNNEGLFESVTIIANRENIGTVKNLYNGIKNIKGEFKFLAADDLYYKNNIFDVKVNVQVLLTPVISFNENGVEWDYGELDYYFYLMNEKNRMKQICRDLKYGFPLLTPGVFWKKDVLNDEGLWSFLFKYKLIEDYPTWLYLTKNHKDFECDVEMRPYVLYRKDVGVSFNTNDVSPFKRELSCFMQDNGLDKVTRYAKWINPYRYLYWIRIKKIYIKAKRNRSYYGVRINNQEIFEHINHLEKCKDRFLSKLD